MNTPAFSDEENNRKRRPNSPVAVIGMACRFPGARNYSQFWSNLEKGTSQITQMLEGRWQDIEPYLDEGLRARCRWGGFIDDVDKFDAQFFGISPREATLIDPQQRLLLELTWSCFEDAGYAPSSLAGSNAGVFMGVCNFDYRDLLEKMSADVEGHTSTGAYHACMLSNRISFQFDFRGPSFPLDTACASSLFAIHSAMRAINEAECDLALAGGVSVLCGPTSYISFSKQGMLSPDGRCNTFDAEANGYVRGEGAGVILLKSLEHALADNDRIYGVIRGAAVNHGGRTRTLTSPNSYAQSAVIQKALRQANVPLDTVTYVETHGTGTPLGDPIEITSLKRAFRQLRKDAGKGAKKESFCGLGAVKPSIGHLESAAGIAGVIKVLLAMRHQVLPPIHGLEQLNPSIKLEESPFYLVLAKQPWDQLCDDQGKPVPRRAGVSSFGFGGANAHVLLEEAPPAMALPEPGAPERAWHLLPMSGKREEALLELAGRYAAWLAEHADAELADVCFTAAVGRSHLEQRAALVVRSLEEAGELCAKLRRGVAARGLLIGAALRKPKVAWLFGGEGATPWGMTQELYDQQPVFQEVIDQCHARLAVEFAVSRC